MDGNTPPNIADSEETEVQSKLPAVITVADLAERTFDLKDIYIEERAEDILSVVETAARSLHHDCETEEGRKAVRSLAMTVSKSKTALVAAAKEVTEEWRKKTAEVNAVRDTVEKRLNALRDEVKAPAVAWDEREAKRVAVHEAVVNRLKEERVSEHSPAAAIREEITAVTAVVVDGSLEEFEAIAFDTKAERVSVLRKHLKVAEEREAREAELEALRAEKAEREAREAREAEERAAREAEERAAREKAEADARAERAAREKADKDRIAAEQAAQQALLDAQQQIMAISASTDPAVGLLKTLDQIDVSGFPAATRTMLENMVTMTRTALTTRAADEEREAQAAAEAARKKAEEQARVEAEAKAKADQEAAERAAADAAEREAAYAARRVEVFEEIRKACIGAPDVDDFINAMIDGEVPHVTVSM